MDRPYNHLDEADAMAVCPNDYVVCPLCTARAEVKRLKAALRPFAEVADLFDGRPDSDPIWWRVHSDNGTTVLAVRDLRAARAALENTSCQ